MLWPIYPLGSAEASSVNWNSPRPLQLGGSPSYLRTSPFLLPLLPSCPPPSYPPWVRLGGEGECRLCTEVLSPSQHLQGAGSRFSKDTRIRIKNLNTYKNLSNSKEQDQDSQHLEGSGLRFSKAPRSRIKIINRSKEQDQDSQYLQGSGSRFSKPPRSRIKNLSNSKEQDQESHQLQGSGSGFSTGSRWREAPSSQNPGASPSFPTSFLTQTQPYLTLISGPHLSCSLSPLRSPIIIRRYLEWTIKWDRCSHVTSVVKGFSTWSHWRGTRNPPPPPAQKTNRRPRFGTLSSFVGPSQATVVSVFNRRRRQFWTTLVSSVVKHFHQVTNSQFTRRSISQGV